MVPELSLIHIFLAAIGSVLYFTNYNTVIQTSGAMPGLKAFVAAVFGGIGSVPVSYTHLARAISSRRCLP